MMRHRRGIAVKTSATLLWMAMAAFSLPARGELQAGVGMIQVTPPLGGAMYGYGDRGDAVSVGVHDPLWAKILVLDDGSSGVALVTLDLGAFGKEQTAAVRRLVAAEAPGLEVLLFASHTHSAPTYEKDFPSAAAPYGVSVTRTIASAVLRAREALQPVRYGVGWGRVEEGHNRRHVLADGTVEMMWANRERLSTEPLDHSLGVVAFDTLDGKPLATLINFACHPVVLGPENLELSADYPGPMMARVEAESGAQAMFLQGAAGDINPFWDKTAPADGGFEQAETMGWRIADEALRVRAAIDDWRDGRRLSLHRREIALEPRWDLEDERVEAAFRDSEFGWIFDIYRQRFVTENPAEIATVLLDERLAIGAFPGEFFVEHGLRFKRESPVPDTIFAGYADGAFGYFPTLRAAAEGGYGGKEATIVEVGAGERLVAAALIELYRQLGRLRDVPALD